MLNGLLTGADSILTFIGECILLLVDSVRQGFRKPFEGRESLVQMAFVGVSSIPIVVLTSLFSGAVLSFYLAGFLTQYGATSFLGATIGVSATREVIPVLAATTVAARCGSAMAAQIAAMAVTEQLDALRMLSVPPVKFLVIPRIVATTLMLPALALVGMYCCIAGGFVVAKFQGIPGPKYITSVQQFASMKDVVGGLLKTPVFGLIIALVACQQGLRTKNGAVGVGRATTNAVVISIVLIYMTDYALAGVFFK